jgi:thioredoxin 1
MRESKTVNLTEDNFETEVLGSDRPVMVDFWAPWCSPCLVLAPAIADLASEFDGSAKVAKVNVDDAQDLAAELGIHSIPTVLFFHNGQIVDRSIGAVPKKVLADKLRALIPSA